MLVGHCGADDTIFTEMALDTGGRTRLVSSMSFLKPATLWTTHVPPDAAFHFALLHGVYPMACVSTAFALLPVQST